MCYTHAYMPRFIITRLHWNDKETIVEKIFEKYPLDVSRTLLKCAEICVWKGKQKMFEIAGSTQARTHTFEILYQHML